MATLKDWEDNLNCLSLRQLQDIIHSMETLNKWKMFQTEFGGAGFSLLLRNVKIVYEMRGGKL